MNALEKAAAADKSALNALIAKAEALEANDYTAESWKAFETALESAKAVAADSAAGQSEVDEAKDKLQSAMNALEKAAADKTKLSIMASTAEKVSADLYTEASWTSLETALAAARQVLDNETADQKTIDAALSALTGAMGKLQWKSSVEYKTFKNKPNLIYMAQGAVSIMDWDSGAWEAELDGTGAAVVIGGFKSDYGGLWGMFTTSIQNITKDDLESALLTQCETIVMESSDDFGKTVNSRYLVYLPVNDGIDRTALHAAVESTRGLDASAYNDAQWADVQSALIKARAVYADKASAQQEINEAAKALSDAVAATSGGDAPITGEIKDIGLTYASYGTSIMGEPNEYIDAFFQVKAGAYETELDENMCFYDTYGTVVINDEMLAYIKAHCKQDDKYVVTIKLYHYDEETGEFTPYLADGKPVEFQVYLHT